MMGTKMLQDTMHGASIFNESAMPIESGLHGVDCATYIIKLTGTT